MLRAAAAGVGMAECACCVSCSASVIHSKHYAMRSRKRAIEALAQTLLRDRSVRREGKTWRSASGRHWRWRWRDTFLPMSGPAGDGFGVSGKQAYSGSRQPGESCTVN